MTNKNINLNLTWLNLIQKKVECQRIGYLKFLSTLTIIFPFLKTIECDFEDITWGGLTRKLSSTLEVE